MIKIIKLCNIYLQFFVLSILNTLSNEWLIYCNLRISRVELLVVCANPAYDITILISTYINRHLGTLFGAATVQHLY